MSQEAAPTSGLERSLAAISGLRYQLDEHLASHTTLQIGGPARLLVTVDTVDGLVELARVAKQHAEPLQLLGLGSNVLVPDEGLAGLTVRLDGDFKRHRVYGETVWAGAAMPLAQLARRMSARGLSGLEALSGFPSTIGGAVVMNAGCYGTEMGDMLVAAEVIDAEGERRRLRADDLGLGYRSSRLQGSTAIVTAALLRLQPGDPEQALTRIAELNRQRRRSMPSLPNAGSVFRNPAGDFAGRLVDAAGLRGMRVGNAQISEKHGNVIVNRGGAKAAEVLELLVAMHEKVLEHTGTALEPELVLSGGLREEWRRAVRSRGG